MAREQAQYKGQALINEKPFEISEELHKKLRKLCPNQQPSEDQWNSLADDFAYQLIAAARQAVSHLFQQMEDTTKGQVRAEHEELLRILRSLNDKLNSGADKLSRISPGLDRLLAIQSDPLGCAEQMKNCSVFLSTLINHFESASPKIEDLPKSDKTDIKERWVAVDLAINVLRILKDYSITTSGYASTNHKGCQSPAVTILETIGSHIGLAKSPATWRDIISDAKKRAPDVNSSR